MDRSNVHFFKTVRSAYSALLAYGFMSPRLFSAQYIDDVAGDKECKCHQTDRRQSAMPTGGLEPTGITHEKQMNRAQRQRHQQEFPRCNELNECPVLTQMGLKTQVVAPEKYQCQNAPKHAQACEQRQRSVCFEKLCVHGRV